MFLVKKKSSRPGEIKIYKLYLRFHFLPKLKYCLLKHNTTPTHLCIMHCFYLFIRIEILKIFNNDYFILFCSNISIIVVLCSPRCPQEFLLSQTTSRRKKINQNNHFVRNKLRAKFLFTIFKFSATRTTKCRPVVRDSKNIHYKLKV